MFEDWEAVMVKSQSTIKMEKGYYKTVKPKKQRKAKSQSTIKMEKGYYLWHSFRWVSTPLQSQSTIKMEKGYYMKTRDGP